ncbi:TonB-dependent receptor [Oceanicola sp. S124]|uniref:TonB-dependent receptor n=1 Tax=Oceanicola sp. S124 TaxID=1042378 RepID=UPI0002558244|nr:TonB-dependent receptor [Oceanicola sp. S124]
MASRSRRGAIDSQSPRGRGFPRLAKPSGRSLCTAVSRSAGGEALIRGAPPGDFIGRAYAPKHDLRPETARTIEAGPNLSFDDLLGAQDSFRLTLAAFDRQIEEYIVFDFILTEEEPGRICQSFVNAAASLLDTARPTACRSS